MTQLAWVCGRGGLLGSEVERAAAREGAVSFIPAAQSFPWLQRDAIDGVLAESAQAFARQIEEQGATRWSLYWCAGAGVVATPEAALLEECRTFETFLQSFGAALASSRAASVPGCFFLASSAGGVHAGNPERPVTERCPPAPISPYGRAKLRQEQALEAWLASQPSVKAWVGRLSNLYGPGQNMDKPQGLVSHMSRSVIHNVPIQIYVPLDTLRDYLFVPDAASAIVRWMARAHAGNERFTVKLCASEQDTTIGTLIAMFRRLVRRHVRVVSALHPVQNQQPSVLQFRSQVWPEEPIRLSTPLPSGIERVYRSHLMLHGSGKLPRPAPARM